jgi:UDP-arabinose 4-epimerase
MHFAAFAYVGESVSEPELYFRNNVANSLTLLEAMGDAGVRHIVFSSTCATYGLPDKTKIQVMSSPGDETPAANSDSSPAQ